MNCPGATCRPQLLQHLLLSLRVSLIRLVVVDCVVVILVKEVHGLVDGCVWAESFAGRRGVHLREICRKFMWDVLICSPCCPDICCRCILWPSCRSWSGGCHSARSRPSSPGWWRAAEESDGRWREVTGCVMDNSPSLSHGHGSGLLRLRTSRSQSCQSWIPSYKNK